MKKTITVMWALLLATLCTAPMQAQQLAFPGAEGFGRFATGGRGGTIYHVTNLNDSGTGSLRDAVSQSNRIIVFDVSGVINLKSMLVFKGNLTVLGQTAPGEGIQVYGHRVSFSGAENLIVRYMRFHDGRNGSEDACGVANGKTMIFDHVSALWGRDETFSINWDGKGTEPTDITIQNSIIGQGLLPHSAGGLIQTDGGVTLYRNLYIDNSTRNPKVKGLNQFINNVVYNWGGGGCYIMGGNSSGSSWADIEDNYFIRGPWGNGAPFTGGNANFQFYGKGNYLDGNRNGVLDGEEYTGDGGSKRVASLNAFSGRPKAHPAIAGQMTAEEALYWIIDNVGASLPVRDEVDQFVIDELTSFGTAGPSNGYSSEKQMPHQGTGVLTDGRKPLDSDGDGIPDEWEIANGLNPNDPSDAARIAANGYANIENYVFTIDKAYPYIKAPSHLTATDQKKEYVSLAWEVGNENAQGYIIERSTDNQTFVEVARVAADATEYTVNNLAPSTTYYWRLQAYGDEALLWPYTSVLKAETAGDPAAPQASVNPQPAVGDLVGLALHAIDFSWENATKNFYGEVTYDVYLGLSAESLEKIASDLETKYYHYEKDLDRDKTYYWKVVAKNETGETASAVWSFTTYAGGTLFYTDFETTPAEYAEAIGAFEVHLNDPIVIGGMTFGIVSRIVALGPVGLDPDTPDDAGATRCAIEFSDNTGYLQLPEVEGPCIITIWAASSEENKACTYKLLQVTDEGESLLTTFTMPARKPRKVFKHTFLYDGEDKVTFKIDPNACKMRLYDILIEKENSADENTPLTLDKTSALTGVSFVDGTTMSLTFNQKVVLDGDITLTPHTWEEVAATVSGRTLELSFDALAANTEYTLTFPEGVLMNSFGTKSFTDDVTFKTSDFSAAKKSNEVHYGKAKVLLPSDFKPFNEIPFWFREDGDDQTKAAEYPHWVEVGEATADEARFTSVDHRLMTYYSSTSAAMEVEASYTGEEGVEFKLQEARNPEVAPGWRTIRILRAGDFPYHAVEALNPDARFIRLAPAALPDGAAVTVTEFKIADAQGNGVNHDIDGVAAISAANIAVAVAGRVVTVSGVPAGETVQIWDLSGRLAASQVTADGTVSFTLERGIYFIRVAGQPAVKVLL